MSEMVKLPTDNGDVWVNPDRVAYISRYMGYKDKCKLCFSEIKGDYIIINDSVDRTSLKLHYTDLDQVDAV